MMTLALTRNCRQTVPTLEGVKKAIIDPLAETRCQGQIR